MGCLEMLMVSKVVEGEVYGESLDDFGRENDLMS